jgi:hypothetical protein
MLSSILVRGGEVLAALVVAGAVLAGLAWLGFAWLKRLVRRRLQALAQGLAGHAVRAVRAARP